MFARTKILLALSLVVVSPVHAQEPEPCRIQARIGGEWTVPQACTVRREGTRLRIQSSADLGIDGVFEDPSSAPRLVGRIECDASLCAQPFAQSIDTALRPVDRNGIRAWEGDAIANGEDVPFEIQLAPVPRVRRTQPPTIARASVPPLSDLAGQWQLRFEASGEWQGGYDARIERENGALAFATEFAFFGAVTARITPRGRDLMLRGTRVDEDGRRHATRARLRLQSDGAYVGRFEPSGPRIEIRPIFQRGSMRDLEGDRVCSIGAARFSCAIRAGEADTWMEPDRSARAPYTLEGSIVRTPSGFRVWGVFQCIEGGECAAQGPTEFVLQPWGGWRGYVLFRGRFIEIEMH
jgi:hypothetical protein